MVLGEATGLPSPDGPRPGGGRPIDHLRGLYLDRVQLYHSELALVAGGSDLLKRTSHYPELPIKLDVPETLVIDADLFERLFEIYALHGWPGIVQVDRAFYDYADPAWMPARRFFEFTRNLLGMLVRDALVEIERRVATRVVANLSQSAARLSDAWKAQYQIVRTETTRPLMDPESNRPITDPENPWATQTLVTYRFGNEAEAQALFVALTDAVRQRAAYEDLLQEVARVRDHVRAMRTLAERRRARGTPLPREEQLRSELKLKEEQSAGLVERAEKWLAGMKVLIAQNSPLGLLALEGLRPGFTEEEMQNQLGGALWELYRSIDELGAGINPQVQHAAALLREQGLVGADASLEQVQRARTPYLGPEAAVADAGVEGVADGQRGWFPLLHAPTLNELVESREIPQDSFVFVVFMHYVVALNERLEAEARDEAAARAFWQGFAKIAAAASLLLLLTPAAGLGLVARGAAMIGDMVLLAHAVSSVTQQLARLDQLREQQLLDPDSFSVEALGRLGELGIYRRQLTEGITQQFLVEVLLIATGTRWTRVKNLLILRGYAQDVETLLADD
jgi:hypothetical protein